MTTRWYAEKDPFSPINYRYSKPRLLYSTESAFQHIQIMETEFFGRMLVLDDVVQLTERDEFLYHEMLAHVPLHAHPLPSTALVIGGGDGGTLREVLRHPTVKQATLVELDPKVIQVCKEYLPTVAVSFDSPRARVLNQDGAVFLRESGERFDAIMVDSTDPVGPAKSLTTAEFYTAARDALTPNGLFVMQSESLHFHAGLVAEMQETLRGVFPYVDLYAVPLATYAGNWWTFSIASKAPIARAPVRAVLPDTQLYSDEMHRVCFVPARARETLLAMGSGPYRRP